MNEDSWLEGAYEERTEGPDEEYFEQCECEIDWNCSLHSNRVATYIETRYNYDDEPDWAK